MCNIVSKYIKIYWHLLKTFFQMIWGIWKINHLPGPRVTIFGGSHLQQKSPYAQLAHDLAFQLVYNDISVITGGGPGIMAAANCGASHGQPHRSLGIAVKGVDAPNLGAQDLLVVDFFFARKWLMTNYAVAFAVFPGGFGTLDELMGVITLMQTKQMAGLPVVLIGKDYWLPLLEWLRLYANKQGFISEQHLAMMYVTDNLNEAVIHLKEQCDVCR